MSRLKDHFFSRGASNPAGIDEELGDVSMAPGAAKPKSSKGLFKSSSKLKSKSCTTTAKGVLFALPEGGGGEGEGTIITSWRWVYFSSSFCTSDEHTSSFRSLFL